VPVMVVLVAVAVLAAAVAWAVVNGKSWEERAQPDPEDLEEVDAEVDPGEAIAPAPVPVPSAAGSLDLLTRRDEPVAPSHRRIRFEDALDLTIPLGPPEGDAELDGDLAPIGAGGYGPAPPEPLEEHVPLATRVSGALRLLLLVAVSAGLVALAVVGMGYLLSERVGGNLGP
jgi:hypothetical protein